MGAKSGNQVLHGRNYIFAPEFCVSGANATASASAPPLSSMPSKEIFNVILQKLTATIDKYGKEHPILEELRLAIEETLHDYGTTASPYELLVKIASRSLPLLYNSPIMKELYTNYITDVNHFRDTSFPAFPGEMYLQSVG
jgi:hypothetical protein